MATKKRGRSGRSSLNQFNELRPFTLVPFLPFFPGHRGGSRKNDIRCFTWCIHVFNGLSIFRQSPKWRSENRRRMEIAGFDTLPLSSLSASCTAEPSALFGNAEIFCVNITLVLQKAVTRSTTITESFCLTESFCSLLIAGFQHFDLYRRAGGQACTFSFW